MLGSRRLGRLVGAARRAPGATVLVVLHLLVFNGLFVYRFSPMRHAVDRRAAWDQGVFEGSLTDHVRLYYSTFVVRNYYEWTTAVLGRRLEPGYPMFESNSTELERLVTEPPRFRLPYREAFFEYPPASMVPLLAARLPVSGFVGFTRSFALLASLAYLAGLWFSYRIARLSFQEHAASWTTVLGLSLAGVLLLGQLYVTRLDVFPSLLAVLAVWAFLSGRWLQSAAWLALGVLTKVYAIVLAPLFGLVLLYQRKYRTLAAAAGAVATMLVVVNLGLGWMSGGAYWESYRFHASRGIQIESLYALVPYLSHLLFGTQIRVYEAHNSMNIDVGYADLLTGASNVLPVVALGLVYWGFWRLLRVVEDEHRNRTLVGASVLAVLVFILTFRVLSPQFLIWLTPLIYVVQPARRTAFWCLFFATMLLTQLIWPSFYFLLEQARPAGVAMLAARNLGLLVLGGWLLGDWWRSHRSAGPI